MAFRRSCLSPLRLSTPFAVSLIVILCVLAGMAQEPTQAPNEVNPQVTPSPGQAVTVPAGTQ